jgi:2-polyprenyl-3-methyl-5-hydroxy-6-metoxy-1,4-benzoquinol methylase
MYANPQERIDCEAMREADRPAFQPETLDRPYFEKQVAQLPDNLQALDVLNSLFPKRGRLLEIGSFAGIFLDRIRAAGWNVTGLEPDSGPGDYARTRYQLNIVHGTLPNPALEPESFDAVLLLHVIEHMPDPGQNMREIRRLLKPGGVLVVETPRFDSLMFKILGRRERSLSNCNGHIYFFTVPTLTRLVEKNGFERIRADLVGRTLTLERLCFNIGVILRHPAAKRMLSRLSSALRLDKFRVHINAHDMQRLYFRAK